MGAAASAMTAIGKFHLLSPHKIVCKNIIGVRKIIGAFKKGKDNESFFEKLQLRNWVEARKATGGPEGFPSFLNEAVDHIPFRLRFKASVVFSLKITI